MTSTQKKIGLALLFAVICGLAFYFFYWIKTPIYSLGIIRDSVQKHDVTTFEKHVDLDTLYNKGFNDAMIAMGKIEGNDIMSNPFAAGIIQMMKPAVVTALKEATLDAVKGDTNTNQTEQSNNNNQQEANTKAFSKNLESKSGMDDSTFSDASVISEENGEAIVAITLHNNKVDQDFKLNVKMAKLDDGTWKVKEITNLVDFLVAVDAAEKAKLAELNKPIREKIDNAVSLSNSTLNMANDGNPFFASYWWNNNITLKNNSSQAITALGVKYSILDQNKAVRKEISQVYNKSALAPNTSNTLTSQIKLNPFIDEDAQMIKNPNNYTIAVEITSVKFADGSTIELLNKLPDKDEKK